MALEWMKNRALLFEALKDRGPPGSARKGFEPGKRDNSVGDRRGVRRSIKQVYQEGLWIS